MKIFDNNILKRITRKEVLSFEPYIPGKPIDELKRELNLSKVYKLASNENSIGVSEKAINEIPKILKNLYRYPDSNSFILKEALSKKLEIPEENFLFGNGSDEIIELMGKTFLSENDEIIMSCHSFVRYKMAADLMGAKTLFARMTESYKIDLDNMINLVTEKTKIIFISNPNNPTGTFITEKELINFLQKIPERILVFLDEAYLEFAYSSNDYPRSLELFKNFPNLLISRTFSKIHALAGLRIGYLIGSKNIINTINRIKPPFNVNLIAQNIAKLTLEDNEHIKRSLDMIETGKNYLYEEFKKLDIKFIPTSANFIMFDAEKLGGKNLFKKLLLKGVIIRALDEYDLKNFARVSIEQDEENKKFIEALKEVYK